MHRLALASGLLAFSAGAHANAGIGYFMLVLPAIVLSLILVVPLEGAVYRAMLSAPLGSAMRLALRANIRSTLWGLLVGLVGDGLLVGLSGSAGPDPTRAAGLLMLLPMFGLSWWIEYRSVARNAPEYDLRPILAATGAANAMTYALMAAVVWQMYPARSTMVDRILVSNGLVHAHSLRTQVDEHWEKHKAMPVALPPRAGGDFTASLEPGARIAVRFGEVAGSPVAGRTLYLVPTPEATGLKWRCTSKDIDRKYLPLACRDSSP